MKTTKKILAVLLTLAMVIALGLTAFAATTGSITVANPVAEKDYTAYKIFDVTYNDTDDQTDKDGNYSYTIKDTNPAYEAVVGYSADPTNGLTLATNSKGSYTVTVDGTKFSAAAFAKFLREKYDANNAIFGTGTALEDQGDGTVKAEGLELGYYFVSSNSGSVCDLVTVKNVTIYDKNKEPEIEKTVDDADGTVEVGQVLNFTIKGEVPSTTGYSVYDYVVSDSMTKGLTFNNDVKVTLGGVDITDSAKVKANAAGDGFSATIDVKDYQTQIGAEIVITYSATVNENAITRNIETNKATLEYSSDPTNKNTTKTTEEKVDLYSFNIDIDKYKSDDTSVKLAGAKFVLKKTVDGATKYYKYDETTKTVSWVDTKEDATEVVTSDTGAAAFNGIEAGTYALEETEAPAGYNPLSADIAVVITVDETEDGATKTATVDGATKALDANKLSLTASVANSTGAILPETGGIGTMIFVVIGMFAVLGAGIFLVTNKRMSKETV